MPINYIVVENSLNVDFLAINTTYWCCKFPYSGFSRYQYPLLALRITLFWIFPLPIQLIGVGNSLILDFLATNTPYCC